jgi:hypothetical protein
MIPFKQDLFDFFYIHIEATVETPVTKQPGTNSRKPLLLVNVTFTL